MGKIFCVEIPHKYPTHTLKDVIYIHDLYTLLKIQELSDLRGHMHFLNAPWFHKPGMGVIIMPISPIPLFSLFLRVIKTPGTNRISRS